MVFIAVQTAPSQTHCTTARKLLRQNRSLAYHFHSCYTSGVLAPPPIFCSANCSHPSARVNVQLDPRYATSKHTTAPINHIRASPCKHLPDVSTLARKQTSDYSLLLNLSTLKDERWSWPSWLTCSRRFAHISGHPSAAGWVQDRESSTAKDRCSATVPRHQHQ